MPKIDYFGQRKHKKKMSSLFPCVNFYKQRLISEQWLKKKKRKKSTRQVYIVFEFVLSCREIDTIHFKSTITGGTTVSYVVS